MLVRDSNGPAVGAGWKSAYSATWGSATGKGCLMTIGYIALVFFGLLVAGGLLYGARTLVKRFDPQDGPSAGED
jgi:hypothetical protein